MPHVLSSGWDWGREVEKFSKDSIIPIFHGLLEVAKGKIFCTMFGKDISPGYAHVSSEHINRKEWKTVMRAKSPVVSKEVLKPLCQGGILSLSGFGDVSSLPPAEASIFILSRNVSGE